RRIETYRGQGSFRPWLCQIAYSRFLMGLRREKSRQRLLDAAAREPAELASSPGQPGSRVDLDRALAMLGDDERHCVVLCYAAGLSHSDAASITGLPLGTVKSHVTRGRARLKDWFDRQESAA
ncbi:MAG TPA: RNA polymerase subunit sigma-70, partial [Oceanicaulis sp.]|nr:RNA polymerase subunit sigma-70 [Oceanicaulis sp.]